MIEKGWTAPDWPKEYGGGGLNKPEYSILAEEMRRIEARPSLGSFGVMMIGPTILEFGTEKQKRTHIPRITRAEVAWWRRRDPLWAMTEAESPTRSGGPGLPPTR